MMERSTTAATDGHQPSTARRAAVVDALLEAGLVDIGALARARSVAGRLGQPVEQTLNQMGVVSDEDVAKAYAEVCGCRRWDPRSQPPSLRPGDLSVTIDYLRQKRLLPVAKTETRLAVAACDPLDDEALAALVFASGLTIDILVALPQDWRRGFEEIYGAPELVAAQDERKFDRDLQFVADSGSESESARLLTSVFEMAQARGASDIHFEPRRHDLCIRLRIDGQLTELQRVSVDLAAPMVSRIKVLSNLDLGERRLPQDGRSTFVVAGRPIDVRVSTLPSAFGETAVLRLLDRSVAGFDFADLGFPPRLVTLLGRVASAPHGIFLVSGPTGSGKTTTLYALLNSMADARKKILSIEDPIEYHFDHVVQTQAAPGIGLTFATALRSFLRQDPDVILVGEIRDAETAQVAVQAAMTGHLVLASLHANDALGVVPRLLNMGVEPYQLAAALLGSVAHRLVRKLCPTCWVERDLTSVESAFLSSVAAPAVKRTFMAAGCKECSGSGFRGRTVIAEGFLCDAPLSAAVAQNATSDQLAALARRQGLVPMVDDGCAKAGQGTTTLSEIMATVGA